MSRSPISPRSLEHLARETHYRNLLRRAEHSDYMRQNYLESTRNFSPRDDEDVLELVDLGLEISIALQVIKFYGFDIFKEFVKIAGPERMEKINEITWDVIKSISEKTSIDDIPVIISLMDQEIDIWRIVRVNPKTLLASIERINGYTNEEIYQGLHGLDGYISSNPSEFDLLLIKMLSEIYLHIRYHDFRHLVREVELNFESSDKKTVAFLKELVDITYDEIGDKLPPPGQDGAEQLVWMDREDFMEKFMGHILHKMNEEIIAPLNSDDDIMADRRESFPFFRF